MLRIRLSRVGRKNQPFFKIVVIPKSAPPKGGKFRDQVGTYDPVNKDVTIDSEKARKWIAQGAQPSETVHNLFIKHGVIRGRKVAVHDKDPVEPEEKKEETKEEKETEEKKEVKAEEKKEESKEEKPKEEKSEKEEEKEEQAKEEKEEKKESKEEKETEEKKEEPKEKSKKEEPKKEEKENKKEKKEGLESLELSTRISNALEDAGIDSLKTLKAKSKEELSEVKGLGKKSIEEIMEKLK
jgi:ribosomal protein S16